MNLLQMSLSGAVLILAVFILRMIAVHKLPKKTFLALWGIVIARLLLPFSVPWLPRIEPSAAVNTPTTSVVETDDTAQNGTAYDTLPDFSAGIVPNQPEAGAAADLPALPEQQEAATTEAGAGILLEAETEAQTETQTETVQTPPERAPSIPVLPLLWLGGALLCAGYFLFSYLRCRREFGAALPVQNEAAASWLRAHPLRRRVQIRELTGLSVPLTYGVFRPVILVPKQFDWENTQQVEHMLFHEYVHIRRFDVVRKLLAAATLCVHWFNPLVWVLYVLYNQDIEMVTDEYVVCYFSPAERKAYALTLISMEEQRTRFAPFGSYFGKNATKERIRSIMKCKKRSLLAITFAVLLVVVGSVAAFSATASAKEEANNAGTSSAETESTMISGVEAEQVTVSDAKIDPALLSDPEACRAELLAVLCDEKKFVAENGIETLLHNYRIPYIVEDLAIEPEEYTYVDLDRDGIEEMAIYCPKGYGSYLILHIDPDAGEIYGYTVNTRWFQFVKTDGTFHSSAGVTDNTICNMSFKGTEALFGEIARRHEESEVYTIEGRAVTDAENRAYFDEWYARESCTWLPVDAAVRAKVYRSQLLAVMNLRKECVAEDGTAALLHYRFPTEMGSWMLDSEQYTFVDLDSDGIEELVIQCVNWDFIILHLDAESGRIYSYLLAPRNFQEAKTDGTFQLSAGAGYQYIGTWSFDHTEIKFQEIAYHGQDYYTNEYTIGGQPVSEAEGKAFFDEWSNRELCRWLMADQSGRYLSTSLSNGEAYNETVNAYNAFLCGSIPAYDRQDGKEFYIEEMMKNLSYKPGIDGYALFDANFDGIPELVTRGNEYSVFAYQDGKVCFLCAEGAGMETHLLENGMLFSVRHSTGSAYQFTSFGADGTPTTLGFFDAESDKLGAPYNFDGRDVSKFEFEMLTKKYMKLSEKKADVQWHSWS